MTRHIHLQHPSMQNYFMHVSVQTYAKNVRKQPVLLLGPPLAVFIICCALGVCVGCGHENATLLLHVCFHVPLISPATFPQVYGVVAGSNTQAQDDKNTARATATDWAASFVLSIQQTFTPLVTISIFVKQVGSWG